VETGFTMLACTDKISKHIRLDMKKPAVSGGFFKNHLEPDLT
jgi:hypothetical protein